MKAKKIVEDWFCPDCDDLIQSLDDRIRHLVSRHEVSIDILEKAGVEILKEEPK